MPRLSLSREAVAGDSIHRLEVQFSGSICLLFFCGKAGQIAHSLSFLKLIKIILGEFCFSPGMFPQLEMRQSKFQTNVTVVSTTCHTELLFRIEKEATSRLGIQCQEGKGILGLLSARPGIQGNMRWRKGLTLTKSLIFSYAYAGNRRSSLFFPHRQGLVLRSYQKILPLGSNLPPPDSIK